MVDPGVYREVIVIEKSGYTEDEIGNRIPSRSPYYRCRAYVNNLSGTEYWAAAQVQAEATVVFTVRYCRCFRDMNTREYSVLWNGNVNNITSIDNVMNKNETVKIRAVRREDGKKGD